MIYDTLQNIGNYSGMHSGVLAGLRLLTTTNFAELEDGWHEVDVDTRFLLESYTVASVNDKPEAHREFIDIQCILQGHELIGVAPLAAMEAEAEAHPERDIWYYRGATTKLPMEPGLFLVLFPNDAHAPANVPMDGPQHIRKCVVKIRF